MARFKPISLGVLAAISLSGCVMWPAGGRPEAMPGYGAKVFVEEDECSKDENILSCAQNRVRAQFDDYAKRRDHIQKYRNAANLALFGIGGAAGVNAVTRGSREGLQTLGLAAAGIVGLDSVMKADAQHETYGAGLEALQCLMDNDQGFRNTRSALGLPDGPTTRRLMSRYSIETIALWPYLKLERAGDAPDDVKLLENSSSNPPSRMDADATASKGFASLYKNATTRLGDAIDSAKRAGNTNATAFLVDAYNRQVDIIKAAERERTAAFDIRLAIVSTDDRTRAGRLMSALNDIRNNISDRLLYSNADLKAIYDALKVAMEKAKLPAPAPAQGGSGTGQPKPATTLLSSQTPNDSLRKLGAQLEQARQDNLIARQEEKPFKTCLALAEKKGGGNQGGGGQAGGNQGGDDQSGSNPGGGN